MFAVIKTGGKQYTVAADKQITVMSLPGEAGAQVVFNEVLALFDGSTNHIGAPHVTGASVVGEIVDKCRAASIGRICIVLLHQLLVGFYAHGGPPCL